MADSISTSNILAVGINNEKNNAEAKTQYIKIKDPKEDLTAEQIKTAVQNGLTNSLFLDANGTPYTSESEIVTSYSEQVTLHSIDIE